MSNDKPLRFAQGINPGTKVCRCCGKRTWASRIDKSTGLCPTCYDEAGEENERLDRGETEVEGGSK